MTNIIRVLDTITRFATNYTTHLIDTIHITQDCTIDNIGIKGIACNRTSIIFANHNTLIKP